MSYYNDMLKVGLQYQDFMCDLLYQLGIPLLSYSSKMYQIKKGENKAGFEIKFDQMFARTGNLWIEFEERSVTDKPYIQSGIFRDDWTWLYLIGDYSTIFIFPKKFLRAYFTACQQNGKIRILENNRKTSKGFLLSRADAEYYAILIIKKQDHGYDVNFDSQHFLRTIPTKEG
jgi:hypothetical protein